MAKIESKSEEMLLFPEQSLPKELRDNLERLADYLLSPHDKAPGVVDGKALLKVINYLGEPQKKAIQVYYGLLGPNYEPMTFAKAGNVLGISGSGVSVNMKKGIRELRITSYLTAYHKNYRDYAIMAMQEPQNHTPVSLLAGRDRVAPGSILKYFGTFSIQQLAKVTDEMVDSWNQHMQQNPNMDFYWPNELENCRAEIMRLRDEAKNYDPTCQVVNKSTVSYKLSDDGPTFYAWEVEHLVQLLSTNVRNTLGRANVHNMVDFMELTMDRLFLMRGIGNDSINEICKVRKKLGFPVEIVTTE